MLKPSAAPKLGSFKKAEHRLCSRTMRPGAEVAVLEQRGWSIKIALGSDSLLFLIRIIIRGRLTGDKIEFFFGRIHEEVG